MYRDHENRQHPAAPSHTGGVATAIPAGREYLSLEQYHGSIGLPKSSRGIFQHLRMFMGPAILVSVGYMDPGNWGTDLAGGAQYHFGLLWVVALSSTMAIILQICASRLGVVTGRDLAQTGYEKLPRWTRIPNWLSAEIAVASCDLAEVLGSGLALNLLFHIPIFWALVITAFDVLALLTLQGLGMRRLEAIILILVTTIAVCFYIEIFVLPETSPGLFHLAAATVAPNLGAFLSSKQMVFDAMGIVGATVMPHNLYLHSALVQTRKAPTDDAGIKRAIRWNTLDTVVLLSIAFLVNAAILVLAAMVFFGKPGATGLDGKWVVFSPDADWIRIAYFTLSPLVGVAAASFLFAIALLASGQSSTVTGTLAGQVVMEGFMRWKVRPWVRRLITRLAAIIPALLFVGLVAHPNLNSMLNLSQVVLSLQLPLAMIPLMAFTSSSRIMGKYRNGRFLLVAGWICCIAITVLDIYGLPAAFSGIGSLTH